jgi:thiamine biosynthesis lipoprotein
VNVSARSAGQDALEAPATLDGIIGFAGRALGSPLKVFISVGSAPVTEASAAVAERAWALVCEEFSAVDAALSRFREDSELSALNRRAGSGGTALVSWRLRTLLATVHRARRLTNGRFDASVIDVLERIGERGASLTTSDGDASAGDRIQLVEPATARASLVRIPDAPIDSGGIGKGLALRWAAARAARVLLEGSGLLVDAGGDIMSAGLSPDGGWRIGVDDPLVPAEAPARLLAVYTMLEGGISTSSVATRNWTAPDGRRVHHLVDPTTREPARTGLIAVSVAGPDPAWNEVWSKALFLGGSESIGEEARRRGIAAWWIDGRGRLGMTPEAHVRSGWVAEARVG